MASERIANALGVLGQGLGHMAQVRAQREAAEIEDMRERTRIRLQDRLARERQGQEQEFRLNVAREDRAHQARMTGAQIESREGMHAQTLAAQTAGGNEEIWDDAENRMASMLDDIRSQISRYQDNQVELMKARAEALDENEKASINAKIEEFGQNIEFLREQERETRLQTYRYLAETGHPLYKESEPQQLMLEAGYSPAVIQEMAPKDEQQAGAGGDQGGGLIQDDTAAAAGGGGAGPARPGQGAPAQGAGDGVDAIAGATPEAQPAAATAGQGGQPGRPGQRDLIDPGAESGPVFAEDQEFETGFGAAGRAISGAFWRMNEAPRMDPEAGTAAAQVLTALKAGRPPSRADVAKLREADPQTLKAHGFSDEQIQQVQVLVPQATESGGTVAEQAPGQQRRGSGGRPQAEAVAAQRVKQAMQAGRAPNERDVVALVDQPDQQLQQFGLSRAEIARIRSSAPR